MGLSQVDCRPLAAAALAVMVRLKAVDPTMAWTWVEGLPALRIGSLRCTESGAQLTVQTLDAEARLASKAVKMVSLDIVSSDSHWCCNTGDEPSVLLSSYVNERVEKNGQAVQTALQNI